MIAPFWEGFFSVAKPQPRLSVSEWAERNRVLPRTGSAEAGPWRNSRTPYLSEIMDELSASSRTKEVVFCKGAQIGATEAGINWLLYLIDNLPGAILAFQPTEDNAMDWSRQRVGPSIELCDRTRRKVRQAKSRSAGNTILKKEFDGGFLFMRGTNTPNALASTPVGNLYFDEVDRYPLDVGGEGDPIDLALQRIATYPRAKAYFSSTPNLLASSRIWTMYQDSDRRVYEVPCPHCGQYQQLVFEQLKWERGRPEEAEMVCIHCGAFFPEHHKTVMLAQGLWRATNPGHWRAGFHLSSLYSPVGWKSWAKIARQSEEAAGDPNKMKVFVNTVLGLPYEEDNEAIAADYLMRRVETYRAEAPDGVLYLTMAVDVQNDRLECEVVGWGEDEESWGIWYKVFDGDTGELKSNDPENPTVWQQLDVFRKRRFQREGGGDIGISCVLIDSGGSRTDTVYTFTKARELERVYSIKGGSQSGRPLVPKQWSRQGRARAKLYVLGVDKGKETVFGRLKIDRPGPGYCHFPDDESRGYDARFYAGLISEKRVVRRVNGRKVVKWELPKNAHNEPFDIRVYNTAAVRVRPPDWKRLKELRGGAGTGATVTNLAAPPRPAARPLSAAPLPASPTISLVKV